MSPAPDRPAERRHRRLRSLAVALTACTLGAGATLAIGAFGQQAASPLPAPPAPADPQASVAASPFAPQAPVAAVQRSVSAHFAILRRPHRGPSLPTLASAAWGAPVLTPGGINPQYASSVPVATSQYFTAGRIWVMPGNDAVCLQAADPAGGYAVSCETSTAADAGELIGTLQPSLDGSGGAFVYGLAPDGTDQATVTDADGSQVTVAVNDNVYAATTTGDPQDVTLDDSDGQEVEVAAP